MYVVCLCEGGRGNIGWEGGKKRRRGLEGKKEEKGRERGDKGGKRDRRMVVRGEGPYTRSASNNWYLPEMCCLFDKKTVSKTFLCLGK